MTQEVISFTKVKLPFGWLGNMAPYPIFMGVEWRTSEALFQALRFAPDSLVREAIRSAKSPMAAKMIAKGKAGEMLVVPRSPVDVDNMRLVLGSKLEQHPELVHMLLETGDKLIIEDCTARPHGSCLFWGAATRGDLWVGVNWLGNLWMEKRRYGNVE